MFGLGKWLPSIIVTARFMRLSANRHLSSWTSWVMEGVPLAVFEDPARARDHMGDYRTGGSPDTAVSAVAAPAPGYDSTGVGRLAADEGDMPPETRHGRDYRSSGWLHNTDASIGATDTSVMTGTTGGATRSAGTITASSLDLHLPEGARSYPSAVAAFAPGDDDAGGERPVTSGSDMPLATAEDDPSSIAEAESYVRDITARLQEINQRAEEAGRRSPAADEAGITEAEKVKQILEQRQQQLEGEGASDRGSATEAEGFTPAERAAIEAATITHQRTGGDTDLGDVSGVHSSSLCPEVHLSGDLPVIPEE